MEWISRMNQAIQYMEEHLRDEIDYEELGKIACCSTYHFQRMFGYMADVSLGEYIRRRRMSLAAVDLMTGDEKVIDVGMRYGYSSPTAFNRAFQSIHGIAPSLVREGQVSLRAFPPISFKIIVKGAEEMNYRIEKKEAFRVVGMSVLMQKEIEKNMEEIPRLWEKAAVDGMIPKLAGMMNQEPMGILGVSNASDNGEEWRYYIGASSTMAAEEGLEECWIGAYTWAIFSGEGVCPQAIQELEMKVVTEWLPTSGYEYDNGPDIERYLTPDPQNAKFEVWIPVTRKQN